MRWMCEEKGSASKSDFTVRLGYRVIQRLRCRVKFSVAFFFFCDVRKGSWDHTLSCKLMEEKKFCYPK